MNKNLCKTLFINFEENSIAISYSAFFDNANEHDPSTFVATKVVFVPYGYNKLWNNIELQKAIGEVISVFVAETGGEWGLNCNDPLVAEYLGETFDCTPEYAAKIKMPD